MRSIFLLAFLGALPCFDAIGLAEDPTGQRSQRVETTHAEIGEFLTSYCFECHGRDDQKGDRRFDRLVLSSLKPDELFDLQDIVDQLTLGDMPPADASQPSAKERKTVVRLLRKQISQAREEHRSTGRKTVLRRLNRREYLNTVGDLFDMNMAMFDPTTRFPRDNTSEHFDNVGSVLVTSGYLLDRYLEAADQIVEKAFSETVPEPPHTWTFRGHFKQQPELNAAHKEAFDFRYLCLYDNPLAERPEGAYAPLEEFHDGVPVDGVYEVSVLAQALNRDTPYAGEVLRLDLDEPFRLGVVPGRPDAGSMHTIQPIQPLLAEAVIEDGTPQWYTFEVPLDRGFSPRFTFQNGMEEVRPTYRRVMRNYRDTFPERSRNAQGIVQQRKAVIKDGALPQIRIHEVRIHGPVGPTWPPKPQRAVLGDASFAPYRTRELLRTFASKAYRRPVRDSELDSLMRVVKVRRQQGNDAFSAFKDAIKAVLCSPSFLYLQPLTQKSKQQATGSVAGNSSHAVASRLSYFLWASMPDKRLFQLAERGTIGKPNVLRGEVKRMLADPRSDRFIAGFVDSWLNLRALGEMPPDRQSFADYYADGLREEMKQETRLFMRHLLDENRSVLEFVTADYSFVNRDLAKLYGVVDQVPTTDAHQFRRVNFDDKRRGGLLGQASVLTVTANGIETSPVVRGVWMLETILGTPPAPPPDDVPAIDPDVRGATSIRDLLAKHRSSPACNECHRKIDPLGFALEGFDPIGGLRQQYENDVPIDTSGKLPNGDEFEGVGELKELLAQREAFFVRNVTQRLLSYATGRRLEPEDRAAVDSIIAKVQSDRYPLATLVEEVVLSDLFLFER